MRATVGRPSAGPPGVGRANGVDAKVETGGRAAAGTGVGTAVGWLGSAGIATGVGAAGDCPGADAGRALPVFTPTLITGLTALVLALVEFPP